MDQQLTQRMAEAIDKVKEGDLESAIRKLKEILADRPNHEISLGMLASIYLQLGMSERAIGFYQKLLSVSPENPLARFQLGMAQLSSGQAEAALASWEPMLTMEDEFMAHFHSALALIQLGRYPEALQRLTEAGRHMPTSHPLYPQLLELHNQLTDQGIS